MHMKIFRVISLSAIGLLLVVSICSAYTIDNGVNNGAGGAGTASQPTASPAAGAYTSSQSVSLLASEANSIRYTIDGSTPSCTSGTVYSSSSPISITSAKTIKAIACYIESDSSVSPSLVADHAYTFTCSSVTHAATYNAYPTCGAATCNSGYTLSGGACVAQSSSGGGGGATTNYCTSVTYGNWATACFNGVQFRSPLTQTPTGCTLTTAQQAAEQRACQITATSTPPVTETPPTTETPPVSENNSGATVLENIATESGIMGSNNQENLLTHLGLIADLIQEQASLIKYKIILGLDKNISAADKTMLNNFVVYGTLSTHRLGAGERAAVINSYYQAYHRLPNSEAEWSDILKIASGRWPVERSVTAENKAKLEFKKVYLRNADMTNNIDENAIMVIAYGLLPLQRNLNSEKVAIKTFRYVYGHDPVNALAWNVVRAIAYSGAKR